MDAAARRPSSPPLTAWLGFGFAVVTILLALRLPGGAPTWAHGLGAAFLLASAPLIFLPFLQLPRYGRVERGRSYMETTALAERGLYAVVRHPQYLGYVLLTAGFALRAPRPVVVAAAVAAITGFVLQAREEDRDLRQRFGSAWESWARDVPAFDLPAGLLRLARRRKGGRAPERGPEP